MNIWPYLSYFVSSFLLVRFGITLVNFTFRPRLPQKEGKYKPLVSILIPAKNEELNLPSLLKNLNMLSYQKLEIIVYDDQSSDGTREVLKNYSKVNANLSWIEGKKLPKGWLGKNHACHLLSKAANGRYLLFIDADVNVKDPFLDRIIQYAVDNDTKMVSVYPQQILKSWGEKATVPLMNWILLSLLPMVFIRTSKYISFAAANGQFMLFESETYKQNKYHKQVKNNPVEDLAIIRKMKQQKYRVATLLGDETIRCRMYRNYGEALNVFSNNVRAFFGNSAMFTTFFAQITTFGYIPVALTRNYYWLSGYVATSLAIRLMVITISRQNLFMGIVYSIPQQVSLWIIMIRSMYQNIVSNLNNEV